MFVGNFSGQVYKRGVGKAGDYENYVAEYQNLKHNFFWENSGKCKKVEWYYVD